jgi:hypothetical protein
LPLAAAASEAPLVEAAVDALVDTTDDAASEAVDDASEEIATGAAPNATALNVASNERRRKLMDIFLSKKPGKGCGWRRLPAHIKSSPQAVADMPRNRGRFYDAHRDRAAARTQPASPRGAAIGRAAQHIAWHAYCARNLARYVSWRTERRRAGAEGSQLGASAARGRETSPARGHSVLELRDGLASAAAAIRESKVNQTRINVEAIDQPHGGSKRGFRMALE